VTSIDQAAPTSASSCQHLTWGSEQRCVLCNMPDVRESTHAESWVDLRPLVLARGARVIYPHHSGEEVCTVCNYGRPAHGCFRNKVPSPAAAAFPCSSPEAYLALCDEEHQYDLAAIMPGAPLDAYYWENYTMLRVYLHDGSGSAKAPKWTTSYELHRSNGLSYPSWPAAHSRVEGHPLRDAVWHAEVGRNELVKALYEQDRFGELMPARDAALLMANLTRNELIVSPAEPGVQLGFFDGEQRSDLVLSGF
jgi:hypothetical protein